jgi:plastocyanin
VQTVNLVAQGIAFQPKTLTFAAGTSVAVVFDNKDAGTQHNFVLFNGRTATAPQLFRGQVITGPSVTRYTFTAPPPGTYFFHCEIHPTQMTGTATVMPAAAGGGPPGALQLTGKVVGFTPTTLTANAGAQVTIHFTNPEAAVQHNVVVFNGPDANAQALFTGPAVTGPGSIDYTLTAPPPGTYFFHCQYHPLTMKGILTVT